MTYGVKNEPFESEIQATICQYLFLRKHFFWRQNSTPVFSKDRGQYRSMPKFARIGVPDILLVKNGILYGLEVKRLKTHQSESQKIFEKDLTDAGGKYFIVRSVEDVQKIGL